MPDNATPVEYVRTDFGFVLYDHESSFEAYGMAGIGRYELFYSTDLEDGSKWEDVIADMEREKKSDLYVYRNTKKALADAGFHG